MTCIFSDSDRELFTTFLLAYEVLIRTEWPIFKLFYSLSPFKLFNVRLIVCRDNWGRYLKH